MALKEISIAERIFRSRKDDLYKITEADKKCIHKEIEWPDTITNMHKAHKITYYFKDHSILILKLLYDNVIFILSKRKWKTNPSGKSIKNR